MYADQLTRWFEHAGRERVPVVESEQLSRGQNLSEICDFLGVAPSDHPYPKGEHEDVRPLTNACVPVSDRAFREAEPATGGDAGIPAVAGSLS